MDGGRVFVRPGGDCIVDGALGRGIVIAIVAVIVPVILTVTVIASVIVTVLAVVLGAGT